MTVQQFAGIDCERLEGAFRALAPLLQSSVPRAPQQGYTLDGVEPALRNLAGPLTAAAERGSLMNPWSVAGLRRDEVRNAAALAGLWSTEFGGSASRQFLTSYLATAIRDVDWEVELTQGYRILTELTPLGDRADRVDLVVETRSHLIGIEVKIDAGIGESQLERYQTSIEQRAAWQNLTPHVVFLASFASPTPMAKSTSWSDIARAADGAAKCRRSERTFAQQLIASFGAHVRSF